MSDTGPEARAIVETDERWLAAFNAGDLDTLVSLYAEDVVVMPPGEPSLHGREAVRAWMARFFEEHRAEQSMVHDEVVVCGAWAFLRGHFALTVRPRGGGPAERHEGKHLVVWRREGNGAWKAARDIWNPGAP